MSRSDQKDRITMEEKFYSKKFYFSYSGLNKLLFSPRLFYQHYILQEREEKTDLHLVEGKVVHALLLDQGNFDKYFIVSPMKLPNPDNKKFLDRIFSYAKETDCLNCPLSEHKDKILEVLKDIDLHQSLTDDKKVDKDGISRTGDEKRLEKILVEANINYYDFLKTKEGKDILDQETLDRCKEYSRIIQSNSKVSNLLKLTNIDKNITVLNEEKFEIDLPDFPFGLKGIVDNLVIDHENKIVHINDLKTTSKTVSEFQETVEYYNYWLQAVIYCYFGARSYKDYSIRFTFIVIDKYQQVYPFRVSEATMLKWFELFKETLQTARWHYENRKFTLPEKFEKETVIL